MKHMILVLESRTKQVPEKWRTGHKTERKINGEKLTGSPQSA